MVRSDVPAELAPPPIDPSDFERLRDWIVAKPDEERWTAIPWETDLWAARRRAEEVNKPIFMWAMNGNPLGCV
jgi:hypothetical protein